MQDFKLLAVLLLLLPSLTLASGSEDKQKEFSYVSSKIQSLKSLLNKDQDLISDAELQLKSIELELSDLDQLTQKINQQLSGEEAEITRLKAAHDNYLLQLNKQRTALAQQTRLMYQLGQAQSIKTILNPDNLNNINRHLYYAHYLSEQRLNLTRAIKEIFNTLTLNIKTANEHEEKLKTLLQARKTDLEKQLIAKKRREEILLRLQQKSFSHQQQLVNLENILRDVVADLHSPLQDPAVSFDQLQGKLKWPVEGTKASAVQDESDQGLAGVMIKTAENTPVHAISSGQVIFAGWLRGFGLLIIINHGDAYISLYARNHTLFAKVGDKIHARDVIAASGNSGGYKKPSVYFEIRQNGTPVDPRIWCG